MYVCLTEIMKAHERLKIGKKKKNPPGEMGGCK